MGGRAVECSGLENRRRATFRGFESHPIRSFFCAPFILRFPFRHSASSLSAILPRLMGKPPIPLDPLFSPMEERLPAVLHAFGKQQLRPGQEELIRLALWGKPCLGVLPTGHGKSLCYQVAAELLGGTSVVVSPLIALMRDQLRALEMAGVRAARYDSTLDDTERAAVLRQVSCGQLRLLFVAPESLESPLLGNALEQASLGLFVVDEAHCVSEWGHSFRPDYLRLPRWQQRFPFHSVMALTATATPRVQQDLCHAFGVEAQHVICLSPYRSNIERRVSTAIDDADVLEQVAGFLLEQGHTPAIVYCRTRKGVEALAAELSRRQIHCAAYHAGQPAELREQLQDDFLHNRLHVLVATIAFGMGIDKPDVRAVVHANIPGSPEAYIQESGRAGRDGAPSTSLVILQPSDVTDARNRIEASRPDPEGVLACVRWLLPTTRRVVSLWELGTTCDVAEDVPLRALDLLEQRGAVELESRGMRYYKIRPLFPLETILDGRSSTEAERLRWLDQHRNGEVESAAEAWDCSYAEAMEQLRECEAAGEWKLGLRQQALCLHSTGHADARQIASALDQAFEARRRGDLARLDALLQILVSPRCLNDALEQYFTGKPLPLPCGSCRACCCHAELPIPPARTYPPAAHAADVSMPNFSRDSQRRRFLLGISSPALMARRLWSHPLYASRARVPWQDL